MPQPPGPSRREGRRDHHPADKKPSTVTMGETSEDCNHQVNDQHNTDERSKRRSSTNSEKSNTRVSSPANSQQGSSTSTSVKGGNTVSPQEDSMKGSPVSNDSRASPTNYREHPSQTEEAKKTFKFIKQSIYTLKHLGNSGQDEPMTCDCSTLGKLTPVMFAIPYRGFLMLTVCRYFKVLLR